MTKSVVIGAAALLIGVSVFTYVRLQHRAEKELGLTVAALGHVSSWHEEYEGPSGLAGIWIHKADDMLCAQGKHSIVDETGGPPNTAHREYFYVSKMAYYRVPGEWVELRGYPGIDRECASFPHLDGLGIGLPLGDVLAGASVRREGKRIVGSEPCRDYRVKSAWREFVICINQTDRLPREIVSSFFRDEGGQMVKPERATYTKWNSISVLDFPAGVPNY